MENQERTGVNQVELRAAGRKEPVTTAGATEAEHGWEWALGRAFLTM